jgi:hypothetical protein
MRTSVREKKTPKLKELCFNLPQIFALKNDLNDVSRKMQGLSKIAQSLLQIYVEETQENAQLGYNHFVSV